MAADSQEMTLERQGKVAVLTMNRPERLNAYTPRWFFSELPAALAEVADDPGVRVLVITGAGRGFCTGADVSAYLAAGSIQGTESGRSPEPWEPRYTAVHRLRNLPKPTIAAVNGIAAGGGLSLALTCDIRIASEAARFCCAFIRRGLIPDGGATFFLPGLVGTGRALELMYTGDVIDAREADRIGLVNRIVPAEDLMRVTLELATRIANGPPVALTLTKRLVYHRREQDLLSQLEYEAYNQRLCRETEDFREAVQAFQEKREPEFKGR